MSKSFREWCETEYGDDEFESRRKIDEAPLWVIYLATAIAGLIFYGIIKVFGFIISMF